MPFVYTIAPQANVTTNGAADTEENHLRILTVASRGIRVNALNAVGKGAGLTAISGIVLRLVRFVTPSTVGAAIVPRPRDPASPAAITTPFTAPTSGATPTLQQAVGFGAAGPGGWVATHPEDQITLEAAGGADGNLDMLSASGTVSLNLEYTLGFSEG